MRRRSAALHGRAQASTLIWGWAADGLRLLDLAGFLGTKSGDKRGSKAQLPEADRSWKEWSILLEDYWPGTPLENMGILKENFFKLVFLSHEKHKIIYKGKNTL